MKWIHWIYVCNREQFMFFVIRYSFIIYSTIDFSNFANSMKQFQSILKDDNKILLQIVSMLSSIVQHIEQWTVIIEKGRETAYHLHIMMITRYVFRHSYFRLFASLSLSRSSFFGMFLLSFCFVHFIFAAHPVLLRNFIGSTTTIFAFVIQFFVLYFFLSSFILFIQMNRVLHFISRY